MKDVLPKVAFVLSIGVLGFVYGFATEAWNLFPKSQIENAWRQARALSQSPADHFLHQRVYDRSGARTMDSSAVQSGLTLVTSQWREEENWQMKVKLLDREGQTVHEWAVDPTFGSDHALMESYIHGTHLFSDGDLLVNVEYGGTLRLDACGAVRWQLPERGHHSIAQADDGTFWISGITDERRRGSERFPNGYPGLDLVWVDQLMNVSEDGKVLQKLNVIDLLYENDLQRHFVKAEQRREDVTHLNDVEPLSASMADQYPLFEAGDLLVSLRNIDLVFVVDPDTREIKWHASDPFHMQHDPDFVGEGWIGVFDNARDFRGGEMLGGSRIVGLQPHTGVVEEWHPTEHSDRFYTTAGGKWQQLDNGKILLTEARAGRIIEVDSVGRTVWEWIQESHDGSTVAEVLEGTRIDLTHEDVETWSCSATDSRSNAQ